jgi:hypothetical protein
MERGLELADEFKIPYVEVSAKAGLGVQEVFNVIGRYRTCVPYSENYACVYVCVCVCVCICLCDQAYLATLLTSTCVRSHLPLVCAHHLLVCVPLPHRNILRNKAVLLEQKAKVAAVEVKERPDGDADSKCCK